MTTKTDVPRQRPGHTDARADQVDVGHLKRRLEQTVSGEVRFDAGSRAMYANDASNFRQVPLGVVLPCTAEDIVAAHRACAEFGAPIVNRGGGTSLSGETVNRAVVLDTSKYLHRIGEPDADRCTVQVQPGAVNEQVNLAIGPKVGMVFGPDPSSHSRCTIGGNVGNNSCGIHSVQSQLYGPGPRTSDNVEALEVVTYDGERFWVGVGEEDELDAIIAAGGRKGEIYGALRDLRDRYADAIRQNMQPVEKLPRRVSGFNLDELLPERGFNVARALVGTESTCVTVSDVVLKLTPALLMRTTVVVEFDEIADAGDLVPAILEHFKPIGLEGIDRRLVDDQEELGMNTSDIDQLPRKDRGEAWLVVQFGADRAEDSVDQCEAFCAWLGDRGVEDDRVEVLKSKQEGGSSEHIWAIRESGLGSTAFPAGGGDHWPGWEDSAVPPDKVGPYLRDLAALYERWNMHGAFYGHFGQGCIHSRIDFDLRHAEGLRRYRGFLDEASDLVVSYGGSLSGEHGDGQQRAAFLGKQYGPELVEAMREFKGIWDPEGKMNPGKVVDPFAPDENLKLGVDYNPARPPVRFAYREDGGDFAHAMLRCVGVGKCRVPEADRQVMCPSYQVTREEKHSTRGRARLLFEMLRGEVITDGWQSREVMDALDLCLSCKGCTNDCPVNVDMPTYKAEFQWHHFKSLRRWRPRYAYAFGFIDQASRVASLMPGLVNAVTQTPPLSTLAKVAAGMDRRREIPTFAPVTLQRWFADRPPVNPDGPRVVLWPDTFNNHLHTDVGVACVEALEAAGWHVVLPQGHVCCGRPLYDYGFLDTAGRYLERTLDVLRDEVRAGTPVVGMEPSCLAVFKDELVKMLPHDDDAERLRRCSHHFAEFFEAYDVDVPPLLRDVLMWGHCHHKATGGMTPERKVLERMGTKVEEATGGCCGLAGSWGFEDGKYELSMQCGEQGLLPAVRDASDETIVVADGFSCKTQVAQSGTGRRALHVAQVMKLAREGGNDAGTRPPAPASLRVRRGAAAAAAALGAAAVLVTTSRRRG